MVPLHLQNAFITRGNVRVSLISRSKVELSFRVLRYSFCETRIYAQEKDQMELLLEVISCHGVMRPECKFEKAHVEVGHI